MSDVAELMKRCQRGVGGRNALDEAHDIMAECYGTLGRLESERAALEAENARLRVKLMAIASAEPARHGIEWAKAHAAEGNNEIYAKWREAIDEARALAAENAQMRNSMLRLVTTHCAAAIKGQAADAELEQYLAAGIAQLEGQRDKLAWVLREKFPRIDPHTPVPLNELDHCCEYVLYQERERLHKVIDAALSELTA